MLAASVTVAVLASVPPSITMLPGVAAAGVPPSEALPVTAIVPPVSVVAPK